MTKNDLINKIAKRCNVTKTDTAKIIEGLQSVIKESLADGDTIMIKGFITFSVKDRAARVCRNPKTNEEIILPASKTVKCKLSKPFIDETISGGGSKG